MRNILGIDQSISCTGLASVTPETGRIETRALRYPKLRGYERLDAIVRQVMAIARQHDLVAMEGLAYDAHDRERQLAGLYYAIRLACWREGIPVMVVNSGTRMRYATGKGGGPAATKKLVAEAGRAMFPRVEMKTDDEVDALLIAAVAARVVHNPFGPEPESVEFYSVVNTMAPEPGRESPTSP